MTEALLAALFGLLIGSFLNVCIYRLPRDLSVVRPRSYCPACKHQIAWYDNVPLLSFALLRGRCRHCAAAISRRYPLVEALTALVFFVYVLKFGPTPAAFRLCLFGALLIGLIFSDFEERILPDEFTLGGTLAAILLAFVVPVNDPLLDYLPLRPPLLGPAEAAIGAAVPAALLWLGGWLYLKIRHREGLGLGDVKMVAMAGAFLGLSGALLTMIYGSVLGSVVGLAYIWITHKDMRTYELPFGTFLGIGALAISLLGQRTL